MGMFGRIRALGAAFLLVSTIVFSAVMPFASVGAAPTGLPSGFSATPLIDHSMTAPTSVRIAPDGRIFVFDLFGTIKIFKQNVGFNAQNFGSVTVDATGDRGLLGAAFDSDFANNPYVYIHYVGSDDKVRIGRFNASTDIGSGFTVIYTAPVASGFQHAGGGITMGLDGKLYFGIGDSGTPTNGQDLNVPHGKLHRINRDGSIPSDNPFLNRVGTPPSVYTYGMRNPFRLTTDKQTGAIYVGDVGFNTWEEINLVQSGKNYGWALQEGPCTSACPYENPVYWYAHQFGTNNTNDASIVAGPVYRGSAYPATYQGKMFVSDYVQGFLRTINPTVASNSFSTFSTGNGTVIDMDIGPDGKMYYITINSPTLYRLDYNAAGTGNAAPSTQSAANITSGPSPLTVNFSSAGSSDPENQPLTYNWNFGDGSTSTQANPTKTYGANGQYTAVLTVSDGTNSISATGITIKVGAQPTVTISTPIAANKYKAGDTISYSASAADSSGAAIAASKLATTVRLYHSDHSHPFLGPVAGGSGQFTVPKTGELSPDVWLRITVEATDNNGVTGSSFVEIQPQKSQITVNTNPAGLNVILDGSNHVIPPTVQGVVGMSRQIAAPSPQMLSGVQYVFSHWSDGGAQDHTFDFPATTTTYTANYVPATSNMTMQNIVANGSFETVDSTGKPTGWGAARWGTNNAIYTVQSDSRTGVRSVKLAATSYTNGELRLYHNAVNVAANTVHSVGYFYKSDVQTKAVADVTLADGTHKYIWLGINQPSASWRQQTWALTTPANASKVVVSLYLTSAGYLQVDDFELLAPTSNPGPNPVMAPVVTLAANPTAISAGQTSTLTWSVAGTSPTCTASGAWSGTKSLSGTEAVAPGNTSTYTLACTNSAGTDTKSTTVTVGAVVPPPASSDNLVANPSFENETVAHMPLFWTGIKWGTNTAVFALAHDDAVDGTHSALMTISSFTSGEARWYHNPVNVIAGTTYTVDYQYKSQGTTKVVVDVTLLDGSHKYVYLGTHQNTSAWTNFKKTFAAPANAKTATVNVYLTSVGSVRLDQFSVAPPTVVTKPVITLSASPESITAGSSSTLSWSVAGSTSTCTANGGWSGALAASGSQVVTPATTTTYTLTCTNSAGTETKSVTVVVGAATTPPTSTNLIANASMEDSATDGSGIPPFWYRGGWGENLTTYTHDTTGRTGTKSLRIDVTNYVSGDAKWFFEPVAITGGSTYTFNDWYKSTSTSELVIEYTMSDGTKSYIWLGVLPAATEWSEVSQLLQAPVGAAKLTVFHVLKSNGTLQVDDYSLRP